MLDLRIVDHESERGSQPVDVGGLGGDEEVQVFSETREAVQAHGHGAEHGVAHVFTLECRQQALDDLEVHGCSHSGSRLPWHRSETALGRAVADPSPTNDPECAM